MPFPFISVSPTMEVCRLHSTVMLDTAIARCDQDTGSESWQGDSEAIAMGRAVGARRILFGSDDPRVDPVGDVQLI